MTMDQQSPETTITPQQAAMEACINELGEQRNAAMNAMANAAGEKAVMRLQLQALEKRVATLTEVGDKLKDVALQLLDLASSTEPDPAALAALRAQLLGDKQ